MNGNRPFGLYSESEYKLINLAFAIHYECILDNVHLQSVS